jgi:hypothetical protein
MAELPGCRVVVMSCNKKRIGHIYCDEYGHFLVNGNMTFTFDLTRRVFFGLGEFFPTYCEDYIFIFTSYP